MTTSRKFLQYGLFGLLIVYIFVFIWSLDIGSENRESDQPNDENINASNDPDSEDNSPDAKSYPVVRVIDGDTVELEEIGVVRLIGIDTPELNGDDGEECYAVEAKEALALIIGGKKVTFEYDPSQDMSDRYGRALGYIFIEDKNIGEVMLEGGFAREYTYDKDYKYQEEYLAAQTRAIEAKLGIWGEECVKGVTAPPLTIIPTSAETYVCDCSKTCPNLSCAKAQYQLNVCGCSARDGDGDGIACDAQCQ